MKTGRIGSYDDYIPEPCEILEMLANKRKHLYGVKSMDEDGIRCLTVCKTLETARSIERYLVKHRDLFFSLSENEEEFEITKGNTHYTICDLNEHLDDNNYVSVFSRDIDGMQDYFKDYIIEVSENQKIVEIEVINEEYIKDVLS